MTISVEGKYIVGADQTVTSQDAVAFRLFGSATSLPTLLVDLGTIRVIRDDAHADAEGVSSGITSLPPGSGFIVGRGGVLDVESLGADGRAFGVSGPMPEVINGGLIKAISSGEAFGVLAGDVFDREPACTVINSGHIGVSGVDYALGVQIEYGALTNSGRIDAAGPAYNSYAVDLEGEASLVNSGVILARASDGSATATAVLVNHEPGEISTVVNTGVIHGAFAILETEFEGAAPNGVTIGNFGLVQGRIVLGSGIDVVTNHGSIVGVVDLGDGDDVFDGHDGSQQKAVYGGGGGDRLIGGAGAEVFHGDGPLVLDGGADTFFGGGGADLLLGEGGDDALAGGAGADTIIGGAGQDMISAGRGDVFVYLEIDDSTPDRPDLITGVGKSDVIDLSAIDADPFRGGDQAFHLVDHFSGARGELVVHYDADAGTSLVEGDVDGDRQADFVIEIEGRAAPHFDHFVF